MNDFDNTTDYLGREIPAEVRAIAKTECEYGVYNFGDLPPGQPIQPLPGMLDYRVRTSWACIGTHKVIWPK